jgi:hypothetical protein
MPRRSHDLDRARVGRLVAILAIVILGSRAPHAGERLEESGGSACRRDGTLVRIPELAEASGIAASRTSPGHLWAHNDSGEPVLFVLDSKGSVLRRIRVDGAKIEDWEAVAVGPCSAGSCVYAGDIGDNDAQREQITIYRFPEPADASAPAHVTDVFQASYPDGPQDAETLLVTSTGDVYIVTKGSTGPVAIYRFPRNAQPGGTVKLERVGKPRAPGKASEDDRITDGSVSPSGEWVVLRTHRALNFYRTSRLTSGDWHPDRVVDLSALHEPQGEGIAFGSAPHRRSSSRISEAGECTVHESERVRSHLGVSMPRHGRWMVRLPTGP